MAAARGGIKSHADLLSVNFNQDSTCISTGTRRGYTITNCDPFGRVYGKNEGATSIVEMLFCTSLVALVGAGDRPSSSTRRLQIVNTKRQSTICELTFPTTILAVKMNRRRLVVVLEERIYIYDISNMKLLHEIETSPNPQGEAEFNATREHDLRPLAFFRKQFPRLPFPPPFPDNPLLRDPSRRPPSSSSTSNNGDVLLFDAVSLSVTNIIQAHKAPISCVSVNPSGTLVATSSDKGTVIRVFSLPNGDRVHEFRRGSYPAKIYSITFNAVSTLLGVSSDTETVHIFKLTNGGKNGGAAGVKGGRIASGSTGRSMNSDLGSFDENGDGPIGGYEAFIDAKKNESSVGGSLRRRSFHLGRNLAGSVGGLLPSTVTGLWDPQRDFAFLKLPTAGVRSVVALSSTTPQVMVVTSEGVFYSYAIDLEHGGECVLQKSYSLLEGLAAGDDA